MFGIFKPEKPFEPLNFESRKYFENNLLWLEQEFPDPSIADRKIFTPTPKDFPVKFDHSEKSARHTLKIISEGMQIEYKEVQLNFYDNGLKEIDMGGSVLFFESTADSKEAAGIYHSKNDNGKYEISLDRNILGKPDTMIATIAHELAHVKLLGQKGMEDNDELLTDLATVFFGFGVFNANTSFQFYQASDRWGYSKLGYLNQDEWAYALALLAFLRGEVNPDWVKYLNATTKKDFEKCSKYISQNEDSIFKFDD
jgi:hypothetical protein